MDGSCRLFIPRQHRTDILTPSQIATQPFLENLQWQSIHNFRRQAVALFNNFHKSGNSSLFHIWISHCKVSIHCFFFYLQMLWIQNLFLTISLHVLEDTCSLSLLFFRLNSPSFFSHSSQDLTSRSFINFGVLLSSSSVSFLYDGDQKRTQYSSEIWPVHQIATTIVSYVLHTVLDMAQRSFGSLTALAYFPSRT